MARTRNSKSTESQLTTAQALGSIVKSCRDIMRKDKGLSGDLDRLPMLVWVMFLKFIDDMEQIREQEAIMKGERFRPAIESPYRWRDWAEKEDGITGDALIAFINQDKAIRPDGSEGAGLFAYLRSLQSANGGDRRDVIATIFRGTVNRMISGYLLRDLINKLNRIHFSSSEEIHTLSHLYESMLKEMRDAAGDSGEFYTPRPVVRFMVAVADPRLGETFLDPACGTGGFLVETYKHLTEQCHTVQDGEVLQKHSIFGGEAKPLPYMLCQMNLLLHGLEFPQIDPENSLRFPLREIGDKDRVDVILTNPPFGGEEERGILGNFPEDKQTSETALLFLQLIMRKLSRAPRPGRAGVVVPNGTLFGDGVAARIKEELLKEFNLHTIVRLPNGVFCALHQHSHQPALLRPLRADQGGLVLRDASARGPQELHQDQAHAVRGVRRLPGLVAGPPGGRAGLEGACGADCQEWIQSGYQEPQRKEGSGATAAGGAGGVDIGQGKAYRGDHGRDQRTAG